MDPAQIGQILTNLCVNARDAIAGNGTITIATANRTLDAAYCAGQPDVTPGDYIELTVCDDGCGMDAATLSHLFEPFFTTKAVGKGTGMGLAMIYGIIHQNNGFIRVASEPGRGTTFRLYLVRHGEPAALPRAEAAGGAAIRSGSETILLVEDAPAVLSMAQTMLQKQGYAVLAAGTPGEALRLAREFAGEIHLLVTDVIMPEMNGRELSGQLQAVRPRLKVLYVSGYTANVIEHHGVLDPGESFMAKPFTARALAARVRAVLDGV